MELEFSALCSLGLGTFDTFIFNESVAVGLARLVMPGLLQQNSSLFTVTDGWMDEPLCVTCQVQSLAQEVKLVVQ